MVQEKLKKIDINYDKTNDVLYASFGPPQEAMCVDIGDGDLIRLSVTSNDVVGVRILDFRNKYVEAKYSSFREAVKTIISKFLNKYEVSHVNS